MRGAVLECVLELARQDPRVIYIGSDLGQGTLDALRKEFPKRFFMEGISEAYIVGMATGLALEGKIPYVNTIATFMTRRCFEQIVDDACLHNVNVRLIGNGGGLVYAPLGPTHMAIEDLSILRAIPNMTIVAPADATEMRRFMPLTLEWRGPIYIRLAKGGDPIVTDPEIPFQIGKAFLVRKGSDILFVTTGITLGIARAAAETLVERGVSSAIMHVPTIKPLDTPTLLDVIASARAVVTVEENTVVGGLGSAIAELIAEASLSPVRPLKRVGIPDTFPDHYGSQAHLLARYSIDAEHLVASAMILLERSPRDKNSPQATGVR